ncbi:MAG: ABC transporter permease, partial [Pseudomonadales bacterium]|nr:ABC transporter permease [Pseudomonadales bacterium]
MKNSLFTKSDFKYTLRLLSKKPGFVLLSVLVLAGGMAVSIAAFTLSYTMFYKPIPVPNGESIFNVCAGPKSSGCRPFKAFEFAQLRQEITTLSNVGVYQQARPEVLVDGEPIRMDGIRTEWNMFQLTNSSALLGRTLLPGDHQPNAEPVIVLAHRFWQLHYDGSEDVIGRLVTLDGVPTRIVGVMPEGYLFPWAAEMWTPLSANELLPVENTRLPVNTFALLLDDV